MLIEFFLIVISIVFGVLAVELKNLLQATLCLGGMCVTLGLLFGVLNAIYVMTFQLLIYAGAIMVLFLSIIMLTERERLNE